jgi:predicted amidohydrolase
MNLAVIQFNAVDDEERNRAGIERLLREAAEAGAEIAALPEAAWFRGPRDEIEPDLLPGRVSDFLAPLAAELNLTIHAGSIATAIPESDKTRNTSFLVTPDGAIRGVYHKIHLFDVEFENLRLFESEAHEPGDAIVVEPHRDFTFGMTICYDLRFPELWHALAAHGADLFFCPANFTFRTGEAHWETLLKARAIETQSYVAASAQWGPHPGRDFSAYGRSMIIDPWGEILAAAETTGDAILVAALRPERLAEVRRAMPVARHHREDLFPVRRLIEG